MKRQPPRGVPSAKASSRLGDHVRDAAQRVLALTHACRFDQPAVFALKAMKALRAGNVAVDAPASGAGSAGAGSPPPQPHPSSSTAAAAATK